MTEPLSIDEFIDYAVSLGCDRESAIEAAHAACGYSMRRPLPLFVDLLEQVAKTKEKRSE